MDGWAPLLAFLQLGVLVAIVGSVLAAGKWIGRATERMEAFAKQLGRIADQMTIQNGRLKKAEEQIIRIDQKCSDNVCRYRKDDKD
jgi:HAMP domain-containing protein